MCLDYKDGKCMVDNKNCKFKEQGKDLPMGKCDLHGDYNVWKAKNKIVVAKTGSPQVDKVEDLAFGLNFLVADEMAYKLSKKLNVPVDYLQ